MTNHGTGAHASNARKTEHRALILYRERTGKTQKEVADSIHVTKTAVSQWEAGARVPTVKYAIALCQLAAGDNYPLKLDDIYRPYATALGVFL